MSASSKSIEPKAKTCSPRTSKTATNVDPPHGTDRQPAIPDTTGAVGRSGDEEQAEAINRIMQILREGGYNCELFQETSPRKRR